MTDAIEMRIELDRGDMTETEFGKASMMAREIFRKGLPDAGVSTPPAQSAPNAKGDAITLGTIILTAFTSGAVVALINCFKSIYARDRGIKCSLTLPNGTKLQIDGKNIGDPDVKQILTAALASVEGQQSAPKAAPRAKPKGK
jgi:hypothetical protein